MGGAVRVSVFCCLFTFCSKKKKRTIFSFQYRKSRVRYCRPVSPFFFSADPNTRRKIGTKIILFLYLNSKPNWKMKILQFLIPSSFVLHFVKITATTFFEIIHGFYNLVCLFQSFFTQILPSWKISQPCFIFSSF